FPRAQKLAPRDPGITKAIAGARYVIAFARAAVPSEDELRARCVEAMCAPSLPFRRQINGVGKNLDVRRYLFRPDVRGPAAHATRGQAGLAGDLVAIDVDCAIAGDGAVKAAEVAAVIAGDGVIAPPHRAVRAALFGVDQAGRFSPLDPGRPLREVAIEAG